MKNKQKHQKSSLPVCGLFFPSSWQTDASCIPVLHPHDLTDNLQMIGVISIQSGFKLQQVAEFNDRPCQVFMFLL